MEIARPEGGWDTLATLGDRARRATAEMQQNGTAIRFMRTIFVPEDDTCFCLYAALSVDDALEAARRAGIHSAGVAQPVAIDPQQYPGRNPHERERPHAPES